MFDRPAQSAPSGRIPKDHLMEGSVCSHPLCNRLRCGLLIASSPTSETSEVILCDEWTQAQVNAFRLMVNRSVTQGLIRHSIGKLGKRIRTAAGRNALGSLLLGDAKIRTTRLW